MFNQILWGVLSAAPALTPLPGVEPSDFRLDEIPARSIVTEQLQPIVTPLPLLSEYPCRLTTEWQVRLPGGECARQGRTGPRQGGFRITLKRAF